MKNKFGKKPVSLILALSLALSNIGAVGAEEINTTPIQKELTAPAYETTSGAAAEYVSDMELPKDFNKTLTCMDNQSFDSDYTGGDTVMAVADNVAKGGKIENAYLYIQPLYGIDYGTTITIRLANATFDKEATENTNYVSGAGGNSYYYMESLYNGGMSVTQVLNANLGSVSCELPYQYYYVGDTMAVVELFPIDEKDCGKSLNSVAYDIPYYYIPIKATAGEYDASVRLDVEGVPLPSGFQGVIAYVDGGTPAPDVEFPTETTTEAPDGIYPIEGGNIYYNLYGQITGCDENITNLEIPPLVDGCIVTGISYNAFKNCSKLESITLPEGITSIGSYAFYGCESLKNINIPESVDFIGLGAFTDCKNLEKINIPKNLTEINDEVFSGCTSLKEITIPDSVTSIGNMAFYECTSLTDIEIPDSIDGFGYSIFNSCNSLKNVKLPYGMTYISTSMFNSCTSLTNIELPESITEIDNSAFRGCTALTDINLPMGLTSIGNTAFYNCSSLSSITLPETLKEFGEFAFEKCTSLKRFDIPSQITEISPEMLGTCTSLEYIGVSENNTLYSSRDGILFSKDGSTIIKYPPALTGEYTIPDNVTTVESYAFYNCQLSKINIPENVTQLGSHAFRGCSITAVTIPESITTLPYSCFRECSSLTEINLPDSLTYFDDYVFYGCTGLREITIPEGIEYISRYAFSFSTALEKVVLPKSLKSVEYRSFKECTSLKEIVMPENVGWISEGAFSNCSSLSSITLPAALQVIEDEAFYGCYNIKDVYYLGTSDMFENVTILEPVTNIWDWVTIHYLNYDPSKNVTPYPVEGGNIYYNEDGVITLCDDTVTSAAIPYEINGIKITTIAGEAFKDCSLVKTVTLPEGLTTIGGYAFNNCTALESINIPASVSTIDIGAFRGCTSLKEITLPEGITKLSIDVFRDCTSLTSLAIPDSVTYLGDYALSGCTGITSINISANVSRLNGTVLMGCDNLTDISMSEDNTVYALVDGVIYTKDLTAIAACFNMVSGEFVVPEYTTEIGEYAFAGCTRLTSVVLHDRVDSIKDYAFMDCSSLSKINMPVVLYYDIPWYLYSNTSFAGCSELKTAGPIGGGYNIEFDWNDVIPRNALNGIESLREITVPESINEIKDFAFINCPNLEKVTFLGNPASIGMELCYGGSNPIFYVRRGSFIEMYAKKVGYETIYIGSPVYLYGDANGDNIVTASDASEIIQKVLDASYETKIPASILDVNLDNSITAEDASQVMQKTLNNSYLMPCER